MVGFAVEIWQVKTDFASVLVTEGKVETASSVSDRGEGEESSRLCLVEFLICERDSGSELLIPSLANAPIMSFADRKPPF